MQFERILTRYGRYLVLIGSAVLSCAVLLVVSIMLIEANGDAWDQAKQSSQNLEQAIISDVQSQMNRYAQALEFIVYELSGHHALMIPNSEKQGLLERITRDTEVIGGLVVIDKDGNAIAQAGDIRKSDLNFADRAFFYVHRDANDVGTYVSPPYGNRLRNNDPSIALSRRISDDAGNFVGVVALAVRLEHFLNLLSQLNVDDKTLMVITNTKGQILSRLPSLDGHGDIGRSIADSPAFKTALADGSTSGVFTSVIDNIERYFNIGRVPGYPLVVTAAFTTQSILAGWWRLVLVIGPTTLLICIAIVALAAVLQQKIDRLAETEARLETLATTDSLTGLANRRHFDATIATEWARARRHGTSLSILLIDADHFKSVNDRFGHLNGDKVLKDIADRIADRARRAGDLAARFGGEEFIVMLPATRGMAALGVAEAIRSDIDAAYNEAASYGKPCTTVSIGVATAIPDKSNSIEQLLMAADQALYQAKAEGRNRTVLANAAMALS